MGKIYYNSREAANSLMLRNMRLTEMILTRSSEQGRRADALALGAEEGRGYQRNAAGSRKQASIRRFPNGEIRTGNTRTSYGE